MNTFAMNPTLSILTPSIPERGEKLIALMREIEKQAKAHSLIGFYEHLTLIDTRGARSIGQKRDMLVQAANGSYVAFVDDDDEITPDYLKSIISGCLAGADVITFRQKVTYCGEVSECIFGLNNPNEPFTVGVPFRRNAWHVCAFKSVLAKAHHFPHINYGEDWAWARHVSADCQSTSHIDKVLHHYIHDPATTAAPHPV